MQQLKKRVLSAIVALSTIVGLLAPGLTARAAEELVNVAPLGSATTSDGSYQTNVIENVIDGDLLNYTYRHIQRFPHPTHHTILD